MIYNVSAHAIISRPLTLTYLWRVESGLQLVCEGALIYCPG